MIRGVSFASCYVYSPGGECPASRRSRTLCALIKAGDAHLMLRYAVRVRQQASEAPPLADFFNAADVLIPVPGCAPREPRMPSVTEILAAALVQEGLGRSAWPGLRRIRAVHKSATSDPGTRPSLAKHYDTLVIDSAEAALCAAQFVLVDDVVTKGRTLLAAAMRLHEAFPLARIRGFALLRTMGFQEIGRLLDPCVGEIALRAGDAHRFP
jgi:predicted amidophosphoribosyltransferase